MKDLIKNFKTKKVYTPEEQLKRDRIKAIVYFVLFLIILVSFRLSNGNTNNQPNNEETPMVDTVIKLLDKYKENNYEVEINIVKDKEMINVLKRMQDKDNEIFYIKYRDVENIYFRSNENYFIIDGENIEKTNKYDKIFEYDETFVDMNNLIKLLENDNVSYKDLKEEKYLIRRYKVPLSEMLKTYNEVHGTEEFTSLIKEVSTDIKYLNDDLIGISMDMLYLNNYLSESNISKFTYDLSFREVGNIDLSKIIEASKNY